MTTHTPDFSTLGVPAGLVKSLTASGITSPFPIQTATLPDTLQGRDVLGRGRTGSGKTLAFSLPLVARLADGRPARAARPRGLVLAPTRELATQVAATIEPLAKAAGLTHTVIFGGVSQVPQVKALRGGIDIVVACPGRLEDLIGQREIDLGAVEIAILDEADHMADLGFLPVVRRLMDRIPRGGQRMLFSATLDRGVDVLVKRYLSDPVTHAVDAAQSPVTAMTHHFFEVADNGAKRELVQSLASGLGRRLLFTRTKHQAKKLARQLTAAGIPAVDLHGNLSQNARQRNLAAFSSGEARVLVATDIAARGIHVDDVALVVHVDPPAEHKAYLHRSGRTARAGAGGVVVTILTPEQRGDVAALTRAAKIKSAVVRPTPEQVDAIVGPRAPKVEPAPAQQQQQSRPRRPQAKQGARQQAAGQPRSGQSRGQSRGQSNGQSRGGQASGQPGSRPARGGRPGSRRRSAQPSQGR